MIGIKNNGMNCFLISLSLQMMEILMTLPNGVKGRLNLNRKKQKQGIQGLRSIISDNQNNILRPIFAGAAVSGLFAFFYDYECKDYFRIKGIPDSEESRQLLEKFRLKINSDDSVESMKTVARGSLANSDKRSNVV
jgi:hypothetical protein